MKSVEAEDLMADAVRPFDSNPRIVDLVSAALGLYIFFVLYPAYALLRFWWDSTDNFFSPLNIFASLLIAVLFGLFARALIRHTVGIHTHRATASPDDRDADRNKSK